MCNKPFFLHAFMHEPQAVKNLSPGCDSVGVAQRANVSKFRKTNKRPSRICGGFFVYDLSGFFIPLGLSLRRCR